MEEQEARKPEVGGETKRNHQPWRGGVALVAALLAIAVWMIGTWSGPPPETGRAVPDRAAETPEGQGPGEAKDGTQDRTAPPMAASAPGAADEPSSARTVVAAPALEGVVASSDGTPIPGAEVSCHPIENHDALGDPMWRRVAVEGSGGDAGLVSTDAKGGFSLSELPSGGKEHGFVLWATHPEYTAAMQVWSPDVESGAGGPRIVLEPSGPLHVLVVDGRGQPVPAATVHHCGIAPPGPGPTGEPRLDEVGMRSLLRRTVGTDRNGRAVLGAFPGDQTLQAQRGDELSTVWTGEARTGEIRLALAPSFTVAGTVSLPEMDPATEFERRLTISSQRGAVLRPLATIRNLGDGAWGPLRLPVLEVDACLIRLEGIPLVPVEVPFPVPRAGDHLTFPLHAEVGASQWFMAVGEDEEGLPQAWVSMIWNRDGRWVTTEAHARPDGYIKATGIPPGVVDYYLGAPGHAPSRSDSLTVPLAEPGTIRVQLERSARITGVCLHQGIPVPDFEVIVWPEESTGSRTRHAFHGRESGSFVIEDAPVGEVLLTAASADLPGAEPVRVLLAAGDAAEVVLELPESRMVRGTVLDAVDGSPLPEATIQLYYTGPDRAVTRWGPPHPVGADGHFELSGFTDRTNYYFVNAAGYSGTYASILPEVPGVVELGEIRLQPQQSLELVLTDSRRDGGLGTTGYGFRAHGITMLPASSFAPDGTLRFDEVSAGTYKFWIDHPNGLSQELSVTLAAGEKWRVEHRVEGATTLAVHVVPDEAFDREQWHMIEVHFVTRRGTPVSYWGNLTEDLTLTFPGIDSSTAEVTLIRGQDRKHLAATRCDFRGRDFFELTMSPGGRSFLARVVNAEGEDMSGIHVHLEDPSQPGSPHTGVTDAEGVAKILGVPESQVVAHLYHTSLGRQFGVPCDATGSEATLVFEGGSSLDLRILDGDEVLPGAQGWILDPFGIPDAEVTTDEEGRARFAHLGPGRYEVVVDRSDCWRVAMAVDVAEGENARTVQMRRLGDVELEVVTEEGGPVGGLALGLRSLEFGDDVASWISDQRVRCEGGLVTDPRGRLRIDGLPRGRYACSFVGDDGAPQGSEFEVRPGVRTTTRLLRR